MKQIILPSRHVVLVDDSDYEYAMLKKWYHHKAGNISYARTADIPHVYMHIYLIPDGLLRDHKNGNGLDNQRDNLRLCSRQQNTANSIKRKGCTSQFKGVSFYKRSNKWYAGIMVDRVHIHLGCFDVDKEIEAAKAYDSAAIKHFGDFARLNFPKSPNGRSLV